MKEEEFERRKDKIMCKICSNDLIGDIIESNEDLDIKISQILELIDYVENKAKELGKYVKNPFPTKNQYG